MEDPRLGVKLELQLPATATVTAMPNLSCTWDLHHSSWQHQISNPPSEARDWTCVLMDTSQVRYHWATMGTPGGSHWVLGWGWGSLGQGCDSCLLVDGHSGRRGAPMQRESWSGEQSGWGLGPEATGSTGERHVPIPMPRLQLWVRLHGTGTRFHSRDVFFGSAQRLSKARKTSCK